MQIEDNATIYLRQDVWSSVILLTMNNKNVDLQKCTVRDTGQNASH